MREQLASASYPLLKAEMLNRVAAIARTEAPEPALHAVSEAVVELERPTRPATKPSAAEPEVPLQVLIPKHVRRQLAVRAAQEGRSLRSLVLMALRGLGIDGFSDSAVLWNAAEAEEKRKDAQVAREIVLALPSDAGVTTEDRVELARSFAQQHFVAKGLAVQLDVHVPHDPEPGRHGDSDSERANWHAHLLITTRRLEGTQFAAKKARDLDPEVRRAGGRAVVADGEAWGELWRDHQNQYLAQTQHSCHRMQSSG